jgi:ubiquinone/menaquinone biosynthesis C-methylase UbiE
MGLVRFLLSCNIILNKAMDLTLHKQQKPSVSSLLLAAFAYIAYANRMQPYNLPEYWNEVAENIRRRGSESVIAGDDEPFYHYKRAAFLKYFTTIPFQGKSVLEIGSGPGGNLELVTELGAATITGVDVSTTMIDIAGKRLDPKVKLVKVNGTELPFPDHSFDIVFTSTVLQHNTNENELQKLVGEICRVAGNDVYIFERIEKKITGHASNTGRPVSYYKELFEKQDYKLVTAELLPIQVSYYVSGAIRKLFNPKKRKEGEPSTPIALFLQKLTLPVTKLLDKVVPPTRDLGLLHFRKLHK